MDKKKILNMLLIVAVIIVVASSLRKLTKQNSLTLTDYVSLHSASSDEEIETPEDTTETKSLETSSLETPALESTSPKPSTQQSPSEASSPPSELNRSDSTLTGAVLNGNSQQDQRIVFTDGFYYEPISDALRRYMTGVSYPAENKDDNSRAVSFEELRYVHILHYGFDDMVTEGELICNESIAQDITEIFYELYRNEYKLERVLLIDEYDGDSAASMADNNTFCFGLCPEEEDNALSKHAAGLAIDINPLYNPCITYGSDGTETVSPESASAYADRSLNFPYKIDETDLCYKLFTQYGFTWGGNRNDKKAYQHFQKGINP